MKYILFALFMLFASNVYGNERLNELSHFKIGDTLQSINEYCSNNTHIKCLTEEGSDKIFVNIESNYYLNFMTLLLENGKISYIRIAYKNDFFFIVAKHFSTIYGMELRIETQSLQNVFGAQFESKILYIGPNEKVKVTEHADLVTSLLEIR